MAQSVEPLRKLVQRAFLRERALSRRGAAPPVRPPRSAEIPSGLRAADTDVMALGWRKWFCFEGWVVEIGDGDEGLAPSRMHPGD